MILKTAETIKELREGLNMTQSDLARKLGVSRSCVNAWEMDISTPSISKLVELSQIFHTSTDYLLGLSSSEYINIERFSHREKELLYKLLDYYDNH